MDLALTSTKEHRMPKKEISYKASLSLTQAVNHLENLVDSFRKKSICLQMGAEYVFFNMDEALPLEVEVSASEKKGKNNISVQITWRELKPENLDTASMVISSQAPGGAGAPPAAAGLKQTSTKASNKSASKKAAPGKRKGSAKAKDAVKKGRGSKKTEDGKTK
jgi:amphi-Trp domain-containing protein